MTFFAPALAKALPTAPSTRTVLVDRVHYYKDAMLGRFYAICNCCSCCLSRLSRAESRGAQPRGCGAMQAHQHGTPMLASSGYVARVDADLCAACGTCADVCQSAAVTVDNGLARIDGVACMGCGMCVTHCPQETISLLRDPAKGEPLEIQELVAHAAQLT
jgi:Pyruvate/2-oxoacid:ferredoxin oxidoreductase delta subunit